jgi:tetratricopeptide (TPR) repeat protein
MAGDWLTQGLQETGIVMVVPWPNALQASELIRTRQAAGEVVDPVPIIRQETGAAAVITGSYYLVNDQLEFRVQITDAGDGTLIGAPPTVSAHRDSVHVAIRTLRDRMMGAVAILQDARLEPISDLARHPPLFDAYQAFDRGIERFNEQDYGVAIERFQEAYALDTTFAVSLLYAAMAHWNRNEYQAVDSMLTIVRRHMNDLSPYHRHRAEFLKAYLDGEAERTLESIRLAAIAAPGSDAAYRLADVAVKMDRPDEAIAALETLNPDRGSMRGWSAYWLVMTHARHMMGEHGQELEAARAMRQRYPDRRVGVALAARALAAMGELARLDSVIEDARSLPPTTYWSRGAAMVVAGEELQADGWPLEGTAMLERAVRWLQTQLELHPSERRHLYWLGTAYYDLARWQDAAAVLQSLAQEYGRFAYQGMAAVAAARVGDPAAEQLLPSPTIRTTGSLTAFQARIAAIRGNTDQAVALFNEAIHLGVDDLPWLHATAYHDLQELGPAASELPRSLQVDPFP